MKKSSAKSSVITKLILTMPVLSGIMWGSGGIFVRRFDALGMDNFTMLFTRIIVAVALLGAGLFFYDRSLLKIRPKDLWVFLGGGVLGMFGINLTYNEAIKHGTLALASVLLSMSPLFVVTFSVLFFHEKMTLQKGVCMTVALLGCVLVSRVLESGAGADLSPIAVGCGIGSAFFYALYSIFSKAAMERGYHALTITFYCLLASLLALIPGTNWGAHRRDHRKRRKPDAAFYAGTLSGHFRPSLCILHFFLKFYRRRDRVYSGRQRTGGRHALWFPCLFRGTDAPVYIRPDPHDRGNHCSWPFSEPVALRCFPWKHFLPGQEA